MKFHSGIDSGKLYQISKADPDLIQNADFIAICKSLYGRTVLLGGGLRSPSAFLVLDITSQIFQMCSKGKNPHPIFRAI